MFTRVIGMGCMTAQMIHEADTPWEGEKKGSKPEAPTQNKMKDRGVDHTEKTNSLDDEDIEFDQMKMPWDEEMKERNNAPTRTAMERENEEEKVDEDTPTQRRGKKK